MIIRKPYAFLIKHFKIIHLLLLVPTIYLMFKFSDIATFFRNYYNAGYKTLETTIAGNYITVLLFMVLFIMILINGIIFLLMKVKKKRGLFYGLNILYYIFLTVISVVFYMIMSQIETSQIDATIMTFIKDLAGIAVIPIYLIILATIIKGVGFDIKSFRFDGNKDLQITDEDYEEVELKFGNGNGNTKRNIVRTLRELKIYFLENKFIFTCIGVVLLLMVLVSLYMNYQVYNKQYQTYQAFALDSFTMTLKDSYITDVDYSGRTIDKNHYYLVIKIAILNKSNKDIPIEKSNFRIFYDNTYIYPNYDRSNRFIDVGRPYQGETIYAGTSDDYVFVYELDKDSIRSKYQMKILSGLDHKPGKLIPSYKIINVKPNNITEIVNLGEAKINTEINLSDTLLGETKFKITSAKIDNTFEYSYSYCVTVDECFTGRNTITPSNGKTLLILQDEFKWDESSSYYKNGSKNIYEDYGNISYRYKIGDTFKRYNENIKDVTPSNLKGYKIFEIPLMAKSSQADDVSIKFVFRNKVLTVHI